MNEKGKIITKRDYPERPIIAVGVVVIKNNSILLIKRNKPPKLNMWSIPGGAQNLGETLIETAKREVFEETGIKIKNIALLDAVDFIEHDDKNKIKFHYSLIDYVAEYNTGSIKPGDDATEAKWVPVDQIESYGLWQETLNIIQKAIAQITDK